MMMVGRFDTFFLHTLFNFHFNLCFKRNFYYILLLLHILVDCLYSCFVIVIRTIHMYNVYTAHSQYHRRNIVRIASSSTDTCKLKFALASSIRRVKEPLFSISFIYCVCGTPSIVLSKYMQKKKRKKKL